MRYRRARLCGCSALSITALTVMLVLGGCSGEPFSYVPVSGKIAYEDGTLIKAHRIRLEFVAQSPPRDSKIVPRNGNAEVDVATGEFSSVTSHKHADGLVAGKHKVLVHTLDEKQYPIAAVPPEYADVHRTPLIIDTAESPLTIKVRKP
jgi:hypothetical protein